MYKDFYKKASQMADLIQEGLNRPSQRTTTRFVDQARQGLVRRREKTMQEVSADSDEGIAELIAGYISNIRQSNPAEAIEEYLEQVDRESSDRPSGTFDINDISDFAARMARAESSNISDVQIEATSSGRKQNVTGLYQFTDDRLTDYMNDTGASFTTDEFRQNVDLQNDVFAWHIADIDRVIDNNNLLDLGYDRDGLRAVAHLGGITGMLNFVRTGGQYNPSDAEPGATSPGTNLWQYYNRFSGQ